MSDDKPVPDMSAPEELPLAVYQQLKAIAQARMNNERSGHTLQTTALVHEAYVKLVKDGRINLDDRAAFYRAAAQAMQQILIDHARARSTIKRGGGRPVVSADVLDLAADADSEQILALQEAISRLEVESTEAAQVVKLRFFAGLSIDETAQTIGTSPRTVSRLWTYARAWLWRELNPKE